MDNTIFLVDGYHYRFEHQKFLLSPTMKKYEVNNTIYEHPWGNTLKLIDDMKQEDDAIYELNSKLVEDGMLQHPIESTGSAIVTLIIV